MLDQIFLFSSPLYRLNIDPSTYNRQEIIDTVTYNYSLDKTRNNWDEHSDLHHSYNDWENDKFKEVDTTALMKIYIGIISSFLDKQNFKRKIKYRWAIENITAYNNKQFMRAHDHLLLNVIWTCVHYISVPNGSSPLSFQNPLAFHTYNQHPGIQLQTDFVDHTNEINSSYYPTYNYSIKENDFVIFPSYLKHSVDPNPELEGLRIGVVVNIIFNGYEGEPDIINK